MIGKKIREIVASMNSTSCVVPGPQVGEALTELADAIDQLEQRVAKLEGRRLSDDAHIPQIRTS